MNILKHHISCPKCNHTNEIVDAQSVWVVCQNDACKNVFTKSGKNIGFQLLNKFDYAYAAKILELGEELVTEKGTYWLTGKLVKKEEADENAIWAEYCFTNEQNENVFLSNYKGHWNIIECVEKFDFLQKGAVINPHQNFAYISGEKHNLYHQYIIRIIHAEGSFNFNPFEDDGNQCFEYVKDRNLRIVEQRIINKQRVIKDCYSGYYLFPDEVEAKLTRKVTLPSSMGLVGNQPFYWNLNLGHFRIMGALAIMFIFAFTFIIQAFSPSLVSINQTVIPASDSTTSSKTIVSENFNVPYDNSLLEIDLSCPNLANDWAGADISLVNNTTDEVRYFGIEAEYYWGVEDGESWTEGGTAKGGVLENIHQGTYHLEIQPMNNVNKTLVLNVGNYKGSMQIAYTFGGAILLLIIGSFIYESSFYTERDGSDYE